mmetsp:Transcript_7264/g.21352  ORF Transcript_7264/g.21352 Transcript_7264/m.21352 type:complete len:381 (+) Transcript_7264:404-1546(+)
MSAAASAAAPTKENAICSAPALPDVDGDVATTRIVVDVVVALVSPVTNVLLFSTGSMASRTSAVSAHEYSPNGVKPTASTMSSKLILTSRVSRATPPASVAVALPSNSTSKLRSDSTVQIKAMLVPRPSVAATAVELHGKFMISTSIFILLAVMSPLLAFAMVKDKVTIPSDEVTENLSMLPSSTTGVMASQLRSAKVWTTSSFSQLYAMPTASSPMVLAEAETAEDAPPSAASLRYSMMRSKTMSNLVSVPCSDMSVSICCAYSITTFNAPVLASVVETLNLISSAMSVSPSSVSDSHSNSTSPCDSDVEHLRFVGPSISSPLSLLSSLLPSSSPDSAEPPSSSTLSSSLSSPESSSSEPSLKLRTRRFPGTTTAASSR